MLMASKKEGGVVTDTNRQMPFRNLEIAYASLIKVFWAIKPYSTKACIQFKGIYIVIMYYFKTFYGIKFAYKILAVGWSCPIDGR